MVKQLAEAMAGWMVVSMVILTVLMRAEPLVQLWADMLEKLMVTLKG